jgi:hypothetical protein
MNGEGNALLTHPIPMLKQATNTIKTRLKKMGSQPIFQPIFASQKMGSRNNSNART